MGNHAGRTLGFREAMVVAIALILVTGVGNVALLFAFERDRGPEKIEYVLIVSIAIVSLLILVGMIYFLITLK